MRPQLRATAIVAIAATYLLSVGSARVNADVIAAPYNANYTLTNLGLPAGGFGLPLGGITFLAGNNNTLLFGVNANLGSGEIWSVGVNRGVGGHITGFSGPATFFASAPHIDGGLTYGPGGVLFYTRYSTNELGMIKPGSSTTDKVVSLTPHGVAVSVGGMVFVPDGLPGAGTLKVLSYNAHSVYNVALAADGNGTFDVASATFQTAGLNGPEGMIYVAGGNPNFASNSALVSNYQLNEVTAYTLDANSNPIAATAQPFITGLSGAEGALVDPVTNDFLFSTFGGGGSHIVVVSGFTTAIPEPSSLVLLGLSCIGGLGFVARRRKARLAITDTPCV